MRDQTGRCGGNSSITSFIEHDRELAKSDGCIAYDTVIIRNAGANRDTIESRGLEDPAFDGRDGRLVESKLRVERFRNPHISNRAVLQHHGLDFDLALNLRLHGGRRVHRIHPTFRDRHHEAGLVFALRALVRCSSHQSPTQR